MVNRSIVDEGVRKAIKEYLQSVDIKIWEAPFTFDTQFHDSSTILSPASRNESTGEADFSDDLIGQIADELTLGTCLVLVFINV